MKEVFDRIYISGPMRKYKYYNAASFYNAAWTVLEHLDFEMDQIINPIEVDRAHGFDVFDLAEDFDWSTIPRELGTIRSIATRDVTKILSSCKAMYMLRGWTESAGARAEHALAEWLGLKIYYQGELEPENETMGCESVKESNPKDAIGSKKAPFSNVPANVVSEAGLAMLEGALKYGRHNYRAIGVRSSVYYDAAMRHLAAWWEGEDIDEDSGLPHIAKAIASLIVLRDAQMQGMEQDDRPPTSNAWYRRHNDKATIMIDSFEGEPKQPYTRTPEE